MQVLMRLKEILECGNGLVEMDREEASPAYAESLSLWPWEEGERTSFDLWQKNRKKSCLLGANMLVSLLQTRLCS